MKRQWIVKEKGTRSWNPPPNGKGKWGPVIATRVSARIQRSGVPSLKKAQELKQIQNLEVPKGKKNPGFKNSFSCLDDNVLANIADKAGVILGKDPTQITGNIKIIKQLEDARLDKFHQDNPDMFLPPNIDVSGEEFVHGEKPDLNFDFPSSSTHISEIQETDHPWLEVSSKKGSRSRRKIYFPDK